MEALESLLYIQPIYRPIIIHSQIPMMVHEDDTMERITLPSFTNKTTTEVKDIKEI